MAGGLESSIGCGHAPRVVAPSQSSSSASSSWTKFRDDETSLLAGLAQDRNNVCICAWDTAWSRPRFSRQAEASDCNYGCKALTDMTSLTAFQARVPDVFDFAPYAQSKLESAMTAASRSDSTDDAAWGHFGSLIPLIFADARPHPQL